MEQITINSTHELLEFIKRDEVTVQQATQIVCASLKVFSITEKTKTQLIQITESYIEKNSLNEDRPIFLEQSGVTFSINDLYKVPEAKKIIDDLEAKY